MDKEQKLMQEQEKVLKNSEQGIGSGTSAGWLIVLSEYKREYYGTEGW